MSLIAANVVVVSMCFYQALHKKRNSASQVQNETTLYGNTTRHCTCVVSEQLTLIPKSGNEIEGSDTSSEMKDMKNM